jgi:hypothetical protein
MKTLDIEYYRATECIKREAADVEYGLGYRGVILDINSLDTKDLETIELYGSNIKSIMNNDGSNYLYLDAIDCSLNGYMQESFHIWIEDYIFKYTIVNLDYNRPNCIKCGTYMLDKIYNAKDSSILKLAIVAWFNVDYIDEDTMNRILEECSIVEFE